MPVGKQMQFFGARVNLAKALLYALNGGRDEISGKQIADIGDPVTGDVLDYDEVLAKLDTMVGWLAGVYVNALNVIHYMHDKYAYERIEMALHDYAPARTLACGIAGLSVLADSLSAIKYATVKPIRDETGLIVDFETEGDFPCFGNNDDDVDQIAVGIVERFMEHVREHPAYRNATHTQSVLTITSNVVYGKKTGNTPDGRRKGEPFAPGANPMHGRDKKGLVAAALSVAKLPYEDSEDGISLTASLDAQRAGQDAGGEDRDHGRHHGRVHDRRRLPHERQRPQPRHPARRDGAPGELPAADHPGLRLRRELRAAHQGAAEGRHRSHVPHEPVAATRRRRIG